MLDEVAIAQALEKAVSELGLATCSSTSAAGEVSPLATLRWGRVFADLDAAGCDHGYATAIELIYEGYLFHYRESRVAAAGATQEAALLAGDCLYARGLRLIAERGDAEAVGLLARLMGACSYLRSVSAPFADDDALWAYCMAGLAALRRGAAAADAASLFEEVDAAISGGAAVDLQALAQSATRRLGLDCTVVPPARLGG